ncbi:hypothetical protein RvY_01480 [Ramazzottius varieornatus]|uniref:Nucleoporin Nup159/Nup146 N-terminal domain-containing protein n=1 Tax=Ramazzottius varieornatus TaxID=947166 RepID=A0A1D1UHD1_RAMVA|nr:hypothetical protein RvY_01480 [Ramazzottius varieornatus]
MNTAPDPGDTKDFRFEKLAEAVSWSADKEKLFSGVIRGITATNRYGFVVTIAEKGFYVVVNAQLQGALAVKADQPSVLGKLGVTIHLDDQPLLVSFSSSGLVLAVHMMRQDVPVAYLYDTRAFARMDSQTQPFQIIILSSTPHNALLDFGWIPIPEEETFIVVMQNGSLASFQVGGQTSGVTTKSLATGSGPDRATCVSWSPKGKQFVVGRADGSLVQYKPDLTVARLIPGPSGQQVSTSSVVWLSTFVFAVCYRRPDDIQPILVIVHAPKAGEPIFTNYEDVCGGFTDQRQPFYHMMALLEWRMLLVASNTAQEVAVLVCQSEDETTGWLHLILDETGRAEVPLVGSDESFPLGLTVLTSVASAPVLLVATTLGIVVSFKVVNRLPIKGATDPNSILCRPPENIASAGSERPGLVGIQSSAPSTSTTPQTTKENPPSSSTSLAPSKPAQSEEQPPSPGTQARKALFAAGMATQSPLSLSTNTSAGGFGAHPSSVAPAGQSFGSLFGQATATQNVSGGGMVTKEAPKEVSKAPLNEGFTSSRASAAAPSPKANGASTHPVLTTIIGSQPELKGSSPSHHARSVPASISSKKLVDFVKKISAHGQDIKRDAAPHSSTFDLSQVEERMKSIQTALDAFTQYYEEAWLRLHQSERNLDQSLHVIEETKYVVEHCTGSDLLASFKLLPLNPVEERKYLLLEQRMSEIETTLKSLSKTFDDELDLMDQQQMSGQHVINAVANGAKMLSEMEETTMKLTQKVHQLETQVRRMRLGDRTSIYQPSSPAIRSGKKSGGYTLANGSLLVNSESRYTSFNAHNKHEKISTESARKLRASLTNQTGGMRVTKHELVLLKPQKKEPGLTASSQPESQRLAPRSPSFFTADNTDRLNTARSEAVSPKEPKQQQQDSERLPSPVKSESPKSRPITEPEYVLTTSLPSSRPQNQSANPSTNQTFSSPSSLNKDSLFGTHLIDESSAPSGSTSIFGRGNFRLPSPPKTIVEQPAPDIEKEQAKPSAPNNTSLFDSTQQASSNNTLNLSSSFQGLFPAQSSSPKPTEPKKEAETPSKAPSEPPPTSQPKPAEITTSKASTSVSETPKETKPLFAFSLFPSPETESTTKPAVSAAPTAIQSSATSGLSLSGFTTPTKNSGPTEQTSSGGSSGLFGQSATATSFPFKSLVGSTSGPSTSVAPSESSSVSKPAFSGFGFGGSVSTSTSSGGSTKSISAATPSLFGQPATTAVALGSGFGQPSTSTTTAAPSIGFGQGLSSIGTSGTGFGLQPTSSSTPAATTGVGQAATSGFPATGFGFGQSVTSSASAGTGFGQPATSTAPSGFGLGQPGTSSASASTVFGQPAASSGSSSFGFGSLDSALPKPSTTPSPVSTGLFGSSSTTSLPTTTTSLFGGSQQATAPSAAASANSNPPPLSAFGGFRLGGSTANSPSASSGFGGFGSSTSTPAPAAFGASTAASSGFGTSTAAPSGFAASTAAPAFGTSSFSGFGSGATGFGSPPAFGATSAFGTSAPAQQLQQQSTGGNYIWGAPGGFAAYAQQPSASFGALAGNQPATTNNMSGSFGQTTQSAGMPSSNAFGANTSTGSGFGSTGFGAPSAPAGGNNAFTQYR